MQRLFFVLFLLPGTLSGFRSFAQEDEMYYIVKDLKQDWLVYDYRSTVLVPYLPSVNENSRAVHFNLDVDLYKDSYIEVKFPPRTGFFIDNTLVDFSVDRSDRVYSIDSLTEYFPEARFFVSLYSGEGIRDLKTLVVTRREGMALSTEDLMFLPIQGVNYSIVLESTKIGIILIFVLYAFFLNNNRRAFIEYYNISNTFLRVSVDEFLDRTASITRVDIGFIIGLSIVMSFIALMILENRNVQVTGTETGTVSGFMLIWVILMFILFLWYLTRIFIIAVMTDVFQIREIKVIHTFELIRLTNFFSLVFFLIVIAALFVMRMAPETLGRLLPGLLLAVAFVRMTILFVKFLNSTSYKKLYLFAYLCVAEVFPVLVGLKILLKSTFLSNIP